MLRNLVIRTRRPIMRQRPIRSRAVTRNSMGSWTVPRRNFSWDKKPRVLAKEHIKALPSFKKEEETALDKVSKDRHLSAFIRKTYKYTGGSIAASLVGMQVLAPVAIHNPDMFLAGGFITGIGGAIALGYTEYLMLSGFLFIR